MIEITALGFIEVTRDDVVLSRHRLEREAYESCARLGRGRYFLRYPVVVVEVDDAPAVAGTINGQVSV